MVDIWISLAVCVCVFMCVCVCVCVGSHCSKQQQLIIDYSVSE